MLRINGTTDTLLVSGYFSSDGTTSAAVESIRFVDGTVWDVAKVKEILRIGTGGDDELHGSATADTLSGGDGNDRIYGYGGNDTLTGEAGNDNLFGGDGNDSLVGGLGDDYLDGNTGDDQVSGGEGSDNLWGQAGNDMLDGGGGTDSLLGGDGNDQLSGGEGNDILDGGAGDDVYRYGRSSNNDVINNHDSTGTQNDRVVLDAGISEGQIWFRRVGNDLQVLLFETSETLTVRNWYLGSAYRVDSFELADGQRLLENQVEALVSAMAAFAPPPSGQSSLPPNYQASLNSVIAANWN
jgi:Ca2+-binding RTX toxin-like protein